MNETEFFEKHGSFCRTGDGRCFVLEAFHSDRPRLDLLISKWGGHIYPPPPAARTRWTWRLYGKAAVSLWAVLRPQLSVLKQARGDRKLLHCQHKFKPKAAS